MYVALYARHSSDKQESSTRDQIARAEAWCAQKGYVIVQVFRDEAITGAFLRNLPGLRDLIEASLFGDFTRVIAEDLSRISRDMEDVAAIFKKLTFLDIKIETLAEGVITELHIGLKGTMNALYLKDLADKTHRGMVAAVLSGSVPGGRAYGYDVVHQLDARGEPIRGLRAINEEEAAVVLTIFDLYEEGWTLTRICDHLNNKGIASPQGGKWAQTVLCGTLARKTGILRQTLYKGVVTFNKMLYRKHPVTGKRLSTIRPEEEWLQVPIPELAIMSEERFERVQRLVDDRSSLGRLRRADVLTDEEKRLRQLDYNKKHRSRQARPPREKHLVINSLLACREHGGPMESVVSGRHGCKEKTCAARFLGRTHLQGLTLKAMHRLDVADLAEQDEINREVKANLEKDMAALQVRLADKRAEIDNVLKAFETTRPGQETMRYLKAKERECLRLVHDITSVKQKIADHEACAKGELRRIKAAFCDAVAGFGKAPDEVAAAKHLRQFIRRIWVTTTRDDTRKKETTVDVDLDYQRIIEVFRP